MSPTAHCRAPVQGGGNELRSFAPRTKKGERNAAAANEQSAQVAEALACGLAWLGGQGPDVS